MKTNLFFLVFIALSCSVYASELVLDHIEYQWDTACQYYKVVTDVDTTATKPTVFLLNTTAGKIESSTWEIKKIIEETAQTPVYKQVCVNISDNKTGTINQCTNVIDTSKASIPQITTKIGYITDFSKETITTKEPSLIRYCIKFSREYVKGRGWTIEADMIPMLDSKVYTEYAWFNNSYPQKVDILNDTYNITEWLNGTAGCNGTRYLTRNLDGGNLSQYQLSCNDFAIVSNDLTSMPFETENSGYNNSPTNLYLDMWYVAHFGFNETGNSSFNSVIQAYDSEYWTRRNVTTGLVGQGLQTDGGSGVFVKNSTNTQYSLGEGVGFGIFACVKPYNSTQWTSTKTLGDLFWFKSATNCAFYLDVGNIANNYAFECSGYSNPIAFNELSEKFYCFTATCDGANCNLYLNNTRTATFAYLNDEFQLSNFNIGLRRQGEGATIDQKLNGAIIDEFMVFKRNLTQADVNNLTKAYLSNSEYKYSGIREYPFTPNINIHSIAGQGNNTNITDNTPEIIFNVLGEKSTYNCSAIVNNTIKGSNISVLNNTNTSINTTTIDLGGSYYNITCTGSLTNTSEQWYMTLLTTTTTTTTTSTTQAPTTTYGTVNPKRTGVNDILYIYSIMLPIMAFISTIAVFYFSHSEIKINEKILKNEETFVKDSGREKITHLLQPILPLICSLLWFMSSYTTTNIRFVADFTTIMSPYYVDAGNWEIGYLFAGIGAIMGIYFLFTLLQSAVQSGFIKGDGR